MRHRPRLAGLGLLLTAMATATGETITTEYGRLAGTTTADLRVWKGIRYAAAPTGLRRWRPPEPPSAWTGVRDATRFGHACPQGKSRAGTPSRSEDCLFLNIYAPADDGPFPVMVWIHGGSFVTGTADRFDPAPLVAEGAIVVASIIDSGPWAFSRIRACAPKPTTGAPATTA